MHGAMSPLFLMASWSGAKLSTGTNLSWKKRGKNQGYDENKILRYIHKYAGTVAEWSKACTVFAHSDRAFESLQGRDIWCACTRLFCVYIVLCLGRDLPTS
jgi:hypothetical protein